MSSMKAFCYTMAPWRACLACILQTLANSPPITFRYLIDLEITGANVEVNFSIALPNSEFYPDKITFNPHGIGYAHTKEHRLVDGTYTHTVKIKPS